MAIREESVRSIRDLDSLLGFLRTELEWPLPESPAVEELTFEWSADTLRLSESNQERLSTGAVSQLRPMTNNQRWGIFIVEFRDQRVYNTALRQILRGLASKRRDSGTRPSWNHDDILFICIAANQQFTFAHFRGEKPERARLVRFSWSPNDPIRTLCEFNLPALRMPEGDLAGIDPALWHHQWASAFDVEKVTKKFYQEIANWYFWALKNVRFPKDAPKEADGYDHVSVIRLITRLIFCWFVKEKGLIPNSLFDEVELAQTLEGFSPEENSDKNSVFYKAILQNLFFATLNTEMDKRGWAREEQNFMAHCLYRHKECFRKPGQALGLFKNIPFLNGGLFECLDKDLGEKDRPRYIRVDGFSRRADSQPTVPDFLFFGAEREMDLSPDYGQAKYKRALVRGLILTLKHYNFTIEENTPLDQKVALDPELSGKVFENLLAAYDPATGATARKQTGSFYTPREIVGYMADEALVACLKTKLEVAQPSAKDVETRLRQLLSYNDQPHQFTTAEVDALIAAIDGLKIIDPAVGSGAFPMGILHKLVFVLGKLDPRNEKWKERQVQRVRDAIDTAEKIEEATLRERPVRELEQQIIGVNEAFERNELDYGRKLYLIENCIYGVDIQSIAVQMAKMRFFISLIVDQKTDWNAPNLGVRPLPNLETKFVAANTLIGVNRPGQQLLRNQEIDKKEVELRRVRERHFNALTPGTKAKYREQDAKLRTEIAKMLKSDGWDTATARKLSSWDPYDQNASANFFDPEWMFGLVGGFDITIGNPPYGFRDVLTPEQKQYFRKVEKIAFPSGDVAELFVIKSLSNLVKPGGCLTFLFPKKSLYGESWSNIRKLWQQNTLHFLMDASQAFENVLLEQIAFGLVGSTNQPRTIAVGALDNVASEVVVFGRFKLSDIFTEDLRNAQIYRGVYPQKLLLKIRTFEFEDTSNLFRGEIGISNITPHLTFEKHGNHPCVKGIDIVRYGLKPEVRYLKGTVARRMLEDYPGNEKLIAQEIIAHIQNPYPHIRITMFLDNQRRLFNDTCVVIRVLDERVDRKFAMAYFHSKFANWYAYNLIYNRAIRTMHFIDYYITQIPFPRSAVEEPSKQRPIIALVDRILKAKRADVGADVSVLEREIDQQVYILYNLTPDEIKLVEGASK